METVEILVEPPETPSQSDTPDQTLSASPAGNNGQAAIDPASPDSAHVPAPETTVGDPAPPASSVSIDVLPNAGVGEAAEPHLAGPPNWLTISLAVGILVIAVVGAAVQRRAAR